jgi:DnaK suppressor protein
MVSLYSKVRAGGVVSTSTSIPHTGSCTFATANLSTSETGTPGEYIGGRATDGPPAAADERAADDGRSRPAYHRIVDDSRTTEIRAALEIERGRLREELAATIQAPGQMTYGSQAAAATQVFEQQRDLALRDRSESQLALVDGALARLDGGTYGRCLRCGRDIAPERLEALPWAEHCIDCARLIAAGRG